MSKESENQCMNYAKELAKDIELIADGKMWYNEDDENRSEKQETEDYREMTMEDYVNNCLDVTYLINRNKEYESVRVYMTLGGPTVYIDTQTSSVIVHWGSQQVEYGLSNEATEQIDNIFSDLYECD